MSKGWIKLHRSTFDNDLWTAEPFTKGQAWVDLIGHANHRPASIWIRGIEVKVERGQLAWSELTMAKRWGWSRGKVRRYLGMLENRGMAVQQTNKLTTILTICKYEVYQGEQTTDETPNDTAGSTTDGQQTDNKQYTNKKNNNGENDENTKPPISPKGESVPFSEIFALYHNMLPELPPAPNQTEKRKKNISQRWRETVKVPSADGFKEWPCNDLEFWKRFFNRVRNSPHLMGENERGWQANLEWITKKENFYKIIEGNYVREK